MSSVDQTDIVDQVSSWVETAIAVFDARKQVVARADVARQELARRVLPVSAEGRPTWHVLALRTGDDEHLRALAAAERLTAVSTNLQQEVDRLVSQMRDATETARRVSGLRRLLLFGDTRDQAKRATELLSDFHAQSLRSNLIGEVQRVAPRARNGLDRVDPASALHNDVGLKRVLPERGSDAVVHGASEYKHLAAALTVLERAASGESASRERALDAGLAVRNSETDRLLKEMPVDRLREATRDQIRTGALVAHGVVNVHDILVNEDRLVRFDGIGAVTAKRIRAAAHSLRRSVFEETPTRIDVKKRAPLQTEFLRALRAWDATRRNAPSESDLALARSLAPIATAVAPTTTHVVVVPAPGSSASSLREAVRHVTAAAGAVKTARDLSRAGDPWNDFLARPADFFALLAELGLSDDDEDKSSGDLPSVIVEAVRALDLKTDHLTASLRGYQSFAARFALVQRKVIIGDEMGLGKTVEAIAALTHLRSKGEFHFVVICPAAVVTNWIREVESKSKLTAHRLHGLDRNIAAKQWTRRGGVAVSTFETLPWLMRDVVLPQLGCVVVDEAHYIKNPGALRTARTLDLLKKCARTILLTGTPLENRLEEFRNLVGYVRPELVVDANEFSASRFRKQVAPVYLRRNQEDVLTELPELVEVDEWLAMSEDDFEAYRSAVGDQNFMGMRQAATSRGERSTKIKRLVEIVAEAEANGRRVIVFSHFREALDQVYRSMPGRVFGPITGSVPAAHRQKIVDEFGQAQGGAVLVAQIVAGGVGLNIQAASVVVLCEPQLKPTTEWQAVARAHRMGQLESVQVFRLLSEEGVDRRIREIVAQKQRLFEDFARESVTAALAPEAYDITESEIARRVIAAERERLFGLPAPIALPDAPQKINPDVGTKPATRGAQLDGRVDTQRSTPTSGNAGTKGGEVRVDLPARGTKAPVRPSTPAPIVRTRGPYTRDRDSPAAAQLSPYPVFTSKLRPVLAMKPADVIDSVVAIVSVEGPVTGWRIHDVYRKQSAGAAATIATAVNRALSAAERAGRLTSENPLRQSGNKPKTYSLPGKSAAVPRVLGPRTIDTVPPSEVVRYCKLVADSGGTVGEDDLVARVHQLLQGAASAAAVRRAITKVGVSGPRRAGP